jgi:hypothetical protein
MNVDSVRGLLRRKAVAIPLLAVAFLAIMLLRRGDTLLVPGVWAEDGAIILPEIFESGPRTLLEPINGYFLIIPKLIDLIGFAVSATQFPLINAGLGWAVAIGVGLAIAFSPTKLAHPRLAALAVFLVPTDTEVFGTGLYTLWWSGLLLFLVVMWEPESKLTWPRIAIIVLAGLSSPTILIVAPLIIVRAVLLRAQRRELLIGGAAIVVAAIQGATLVIRTLTTRDAETELPRIDRVVPNFFGNYWFNIWTDSPNRLLLAGIVLIAVLIGGIVLIRTDRIWAATLLVLVAISIAVSMSRIGDRPIDPILAGPRYFFFPFVLISWTLLQLIVSWRVRYLWIAPALIVGLATVNASGGWSRSNDDLAWAHHLESCTRFDSYTVPVHFAGQRAYTWEMDVTGAECSAWLDRDPFRGTGTDAAFAFSVSLLQPDGTPRRVPRLAESDFHEALSSEPPVPRSVVLTSAGSPGHQASFHLRHGQSLIVRTSDLTDGLRMTIDGSDTQFDAGIRPMYGWSKLTFANRDLPDEFDVVIEDTDGEASWIEIAVADE